MVILDTHSIIAELYDTLSALHCFDVEEEDLMALLGDNIAIDFNYQINACHSTYATYASSKSYAGYDFDIWLCGLNKAHDNILCLLRASLDPTQYGIEYYTAVSGNLAFKEYQKE